jgi:hypothetical protein
MPQNSSDTDNKNNGNDGDTNEKEVELSPEVQKLVEEEAAKKLATIKLNLDKAYQERDQHKRQAEEAAEKLRKAEIEALKAAGKEREALQAELEDTRKKAEAAAAQVTMLSRDSEVRRVLATLEFKSQRAFDMAFSDIISNLVKNDDGNWYSRTGKSIQDTVTEYKTDPANEFLFKVKANTGGGNSSSSSRQTDDSNQSLFALSQEKVLEMAAKGNLRRRNR